MEGSVLWIVSELFYPDETSTAYIMGELANAFASKYKVKVICGPELYDKRKSLDKNNAFVLDSSIEIFRTEGTPFDKNTSIGKALNLFLMTRRLIKLASSKIKQGDKVLMVTNPAPMILQMSKLKKKLGFELNILVHDVFPENTIPAGIKLPGYGFIKGLFDKAFSRADQFIVLGRDMENVVRQKVSSYISSPRVSVVENWADIESIYPQLPPDGKLILQYAGNIGRVQGLEQIVEQLPDNLELHFYGTGAMENKLKSLNKQNVVFHGSYFRSQQNEILAHCHAAIVTLQEGMYGLGVPSKTYNILASGRPIIYFGPSESEVELLIKEEGIGYCGWPDQWDRELLVEMGKRARCVAENRYSKERILDRFLGII